MTSEPLISVVIPSYNYGHFVTTAVESVLVQTYAHREVIVVDDGSTDDTRQRLAPYMDRIQYIHQANAGLAAARNTGIRAAGGEWIALLDADDVFHPRKLELQMRCLREQPPDISLLATDTFLDQRSAWPDVDKISPEVIRYDLEDLVGTCRFGPSTALIRKSCLETVGLFDPALRSVEDRDMWIRLAGRCTLAKLLVPLLFYRVHASSLSNQSAAMEKYELQVLDKSFAQVPALRGRWTLKRKSYSRAAFMAAQVFRANGQPMRALQRLLLSYLHWPLPLPIPGKGYFLRTKVLFVLLLRMLRLMPPEVELAAKTVATPPPLPALPPRAEADPAIVRHVKPATNVAPVPSTPA